MQPTCSSHHGCISTPTLIIDIKQIVWKIRNFIKLKRFLCGFSYFFFWKIHSKQIQTVKWNILLSMTMQLKRQICTNVKKYFYISECRFGGESYELEQTWNPDLGPPFGVMHCVHCECVPVGVTTDASILYYTMNILKYFQRSFFIWPNMLFHL